MEDEQGYRLIDGDQNNNVKHNNDSNRGETSTFFNNDYQLDRINVVRTSNTRNNSGYFNNINDVLTSIYNLDNDGKMTKIIVIALLFHPIVSLFIQDNPIVQKVLTLKQRKLISITLLVFMSLCLLGFFWTNPHGSNGLLICSLKLLLFICILIHSGIINKFIKKNMLKKN